MLEDGWLCAHTDQNVPGDLEDTPDDVVERSNDGDVEAMQSNEHQEEKGCCDPKNAWVFECGECWNAVVAVFTAHLIWPQQQLQVLRVKIGEGDLAPQATWERVEWVLHLPNEATVTEIDATAKDDLSALEEPDDGEKGKHPEDEGVVRNWRIGPNALAKPTRGDKVEKPDTSEPP